MKKRHVQAMMAGMTVMLSLAMPVTTVWAAVPEKEQTVYVNADGNGNTEKIIVSNWLKNIGKDASLEDKSDLTDIRNVKGEETFSKDNNGSLTWKADGEDIYYQGESTKELPVSVKMTYFLDDKEIKASDLAGKSGKVKIRIDYENHSGRETTVNGKTEMIYTPFMMVTGMILPAETFTNVEVKNGKVISDGKNDIVVGMGFPGLAESLKLSDIQGMEEEKIPDYVEITADAEGFSLALTATVATTGTLKELGLDGAGSLDELKEKMDLLTDSSGMLVEGTRQLKEGVQELNASADVFVEGLKSADDGAGQVKAGIDMINQKKGELLSGLDQFESGLTALNSGAKTLQAGVSDYTGNASKLSQGIGKLYEELQKSMAVFEQIPEVLGNLQTGITELCKGAAQLQQGAQMACEASENLQGQLEGLKAGVTGAEGYIHQALGAIDDLPPEAQEQLNSAKQGLETIASNLNSVKVDTESMAKLTEGAKRAVSGAEKMQEELGNISQSVSGMGDMSSLFEGVKELKAGSDLLCSYNQTLNSGAKQLVSGSDALLKGVAEVKKGTGELSGGLGRLSKGAFVLKDGTAKLLQGGKELKTGTMQLEEGAVTLSDSMEKFNREGIRKLNEVLGGEMQSVLNRLKAVVDADEAYTAFDGVNEGAGGSVKFIIETAGIE